MARTKKSVGFGKWRGIEDGVAVFGPATKEEVEEWATAPPPKPDLSAHEAYLARLRTEPNQPRRDEEADLRAVLLKRRNAAEAEMILRVMRPVLISGRRARLLRRRTQVLPAPAPVAA